MLPVQWTFVWQTMEGPTLGPLYDSEREALDGLYAEWVGFGGGTAGGFSDGTRAEFDAMFEVSPVLAVCPIG